MFSRSPRERSIPERRRFNQTHVLEATAAAVFATAILGTATGVGWLVTALPNKLDELQTQITALKNSQNTFQINFNQRFNGVEQQVRSHEARIIKLEVAPR